MVKNFSRGKEGEGLLQFQEYHRKRGGGGNRVSGQGGREEQGCFKKEKRAKSFLIAKRRGRKRLLPDSQRVGAQAQRFAAGKRGGAGSSTKKKREERSILIIPEKERKGGLFHYDVLQKGLRRKEATVSQKKRGIPSVRNSTGAKMRTGKVTMMWILREKGGRQRGRGHFSASRREKGYFLGQGGCISDDQRKKGGGLGKGRVLPEKKPPLSRKKKKQFYQEKPVGAGEISNPVAIIKKRPPSQASKRGSTLTRECFSGEGVKGLLRRKKSSGRVSFEGETTKSRHRPEEGRLAATKKKTSLKHGEKKKKGSCMSGQGKYGKTGLLSKEPGIVDGEIRKAGESPRASTKGGIFWREQRDCALEREGKNQTKAHAAVEKKKFSKGDTSRESKRGGKGRMLTVGGDYYLHTGRRETLCGRKEKSTWGKKSKLEKEKKGGHRQLEGENYLTS